MPSRRELLDCAISTWYPRFAAVTFRTELVPLSPAFVAWLLADGLVLPPGSAAFPTRSRRDPLDDYRDWTSEEEEEEAAGGGAGEAGGLEGEGGAENAAAAALPPDYEAVRGAAAAALAALGGAALPKLSWSAPLDAVWAAAGGRLRVEHADEALLLLKASDRVAHDAGRALAECDAAADAPLNAASAPGAAAPGASGAAAEPAFQHVLALRAWADLRPGREFRCFVSHERLVGASQRDVTQRFPALGDAGALANLAARIAEFYTRSIAGRFPHAAHAFDVYVPTAAAARVRLVDFGPRGGTTAPLLFSWEEVEALGAAAEAAAAAGAAAAPLELRVVEQEAPLRPGAAALYGVPHDFVDAGAAGGALAALLARAGGPGARGGASLFEELAARAGAGGAEE